MSDPQGPSARSADPPNLLDQLRRRGVLRVAVSYAVIGWLLLQIGDVVLEPLNAPAWTMRAMIILLATGFPIALALAWYFELGPGGVSVDHLPGQAARPATRGIRRYADAIVIAVLLAVIVLLLARQGGLLETESGPPVLAVLPFTEIGGADETYFGDGLSDTLIHKLGQVSGLVVLASTSTFEFRGADQDLATVARKLDASTILLGSLQRAGGMLRINARLVDAASGRQQWTASFDRDAGDLFAVQDEIAEAVTSALQVVMAPREEERLSHRDTEDLSAYDVYLKGRESIATRTADGMTAAITYLRKAVEIDPEFALAHAALAEAFYLAATYSWANWSWDRVSSEAHAAAARAQALDPGLGEAWLAQAFAALGDNEHSPTDRPWPDEYVRPLLEKTVELSPNNAQAWKFLSHLTADPDTSLEHLKQAARLDPRSGIILTNLGSSYLRRGDEERARQFFMRAIGTVEPLFELGLFSLMGAYLDQVSELSLAARWARYGHLRMDGRFGAVTREYGLILMELGAWDELDQALKIAEADSAVRGQPLLYRTGLRVRWLRARGDLDAAAGLATQFKQSVESTFQGRMPEIWPDTPPANVLSALPLRWLREGDAASALAHFEAVFPNIQNQMPVEAVGDPLNALVLSAATLKQLGRGEEAAQRLKAYLEHLGALAEIDAADTALGRFAAHAFLGETDAAITAFEQAVNAGKFLGWWGLRDGAFDADYAAVLADPRFQRAFARLEAGIAEQREAFLADPDLPAEELILAGLEKLPPR